ncbi:MAG: archaetidylserine decarboxylase [Chromatiaceae bacterium]|nr:archaetidylserine decarboxylase [Chromatiaceae bacterium]
MGRFSRVRNPLVRELSFFIWKRFADDLKLEDADQDEFESLHDCFTRRLKPGLRPIDPDPAVLVSPCDSVVGAAGPVAGQQVFQAKGFPYELTELFGDEVSHEKYRDGLFVTLRLKSSMYHRFHAPCDGKVRAVTYISGDTWNVNPIALKRIEKLFCKNERALIEMDLSGTEHSIALVPVAAILVASIQLCFLDYPLDLKYLGPNRIECNETFRKGDEMGFFQQGSTIVLFAPRGYQLCDNLKEGGYIKMGEALLRRL